MFDLFATMMHRFIFRFAFGLILMGMTQAGAWGAETSALSDEAKPLQIDEVPDRVPPIIELGDTFLGAGNINAGFTLPTGAVWQPNFIMWGNYRTAVNYFDSEAITGDDHVTEWVNRLDLFGQLSLSQTERLVIGIRPLDDEGEFSGYSFNSPDEDKDGDRVSEYNTDIAVLFFEGNLAEIFPGIGRTQRRSLDIDFSIGRQPFQLQQGVLVADTMDSIALARNNITVVPGATNTRVSLLYGWDEVNRGDNVKDSDAKLFGLFTETDFSVSTVNLDFVYVDSKSTGDGFYTGLSAVQRLGKINTAFRIMHAEPTDGSTVQTTRGTLTAAEFSWTPAYTHNNVYTNFFWADDEFNSASRSEDAGGPLGLIGILYAATGLGAYPGPLGSDAIESVGGAAGYQMFFDNSRRQLILEVGGRADTDSTDRNQTAFGARFQQALGNRYVLRFDGFVSKQQKFDTGWGARVELQVKL